MITEDYVSYGVAELLKEKGFDEECYQKYDGEGYLSFNHVGYINAEKPNEDFSALAPTHQMAMKWLRKVHKVFFCVHPDYPISKDYLVEFYDEGRPSGCFGNYPTYEKAVEAALKYSLENLI